MDLNAMAKNVLLLSGTWMSVQSWVGIHPVFMETFPSKPHGGAIVVQIAGFLVHIITVNATYYESPFPFQNPILFIGLIQCFLSGDPQEWSPDPQVEYQWANHHECQKCKCVPLLDSQNASDTNKWHYRKHIYKCAAFAKELFDYKYNGLSVFYVTPENERT